jgi:hypothetical protein
VAAELNRLGLIWRETPSADVGIDGQVELVNDTDEATGWLLAAQVKSGASYFRDGDEAWHFSPHPRHRTYWERFPLPVLLFLHHPDRGETFWVDARQALRSPERSRLPFVAVPKRNLLQATTREGFFAELGASARPLLPIDAVLAILVARTSPSAAFPLSHFDLFANGLTNGARSLYFGMDLAVEVATAVNEDDSLAVGPAEHGFLFDFVLFLVEQHLAVVDVADCLVDWVERQIQPVFIAPLTSRGRHLVDRIGEHQARMQRAGDLPDVGYLRVAQEGFVRMEFTATHRERIQLIAAFREHFRQGRSGG